MHGVPLYAADAWRALEQIRAIELALARGCNILDAVMTRKHERETELDSKSR